MIHNTAIIDKNANVHSNSEVGAYCIIGPQVRIGEGCYIHPHVVIDGNTEIKENCVIFPFSAIGTPAQDLHLPKDFKGNVHISKNVTIREQVTIHASTKSEDVTFIDENCFLMATSHIAHDCKIGKNVIMANSSMLAGHVQIGKNVFISGGAAIHQFARVGDFAFVIACSRTVQDIPPFCMTAGTSPTEFAGLNVVGLRRAGFTQEERNIIKRAYKVLYKTGIKTTDSLKELESKASHQLEKDIITFVQSAERGIIRAWQGRKSSL